MLRQLRKISAVPDAFRQGPLRGKDRFLCPARSCRKRKKAVLSVSTQHRRKKFHANARPKHLPLEKKGANGYNGPVVQLYCCCAEW